MSDQQDIQMPQKITFQGKEYEIDSLSDEQKNQVATAMKTREILSSAQQIADVFANMPGIISLAIKGAAAQADEVVKSFPPPTSSAPAAPPVVTTEELPGEKPVEEIKEEKTH